LRERYQNIESYKINLYREKRVILCRRPTCRLQRLLLLFRLELLFDRNLLLTVGIAAPMVDSAQLDISASFTKVGTSVALILVALTMHLALFQCRVYRQRRQQYQRAGTTRLPATTGVIQYQYFYWTNTWSIVHIFWSPPYEAG
jgi:hypothetical protein